MGSYALTGLRLGRVWTYGGIELRIPEGGRTDLAPRHYRVPFVVGRQLGWFRELVEGLGYGSERTDV